MKIQQKYRHHQVAQALHSSARRLAQSLAKARYPAQPWVWYWPLLLGATQLAIALSPPVARPSHAAERITVSVGLTIERSISVNSLEVFAEEGRITDELAPYIPFIEQGNPEALAQVRDLLTQRLDVDVTTVAQFAYTPQGEQVLDQLGEVFRTGARLPGGQGLRGAAIVSAADDTAGLTVLNVIRNFPTPVLRIDLRQGFAIANQATALINQTTTALDVVEQLSLETATTPFPEGVAFADLLELTSPGPLQTRRLQLRLKASIKPVDIYLPTPTATGLGSAGIPTGISTGISTGTTAQPPWPAVIISHGFGSERASYAYLARFLAEHGFAVITVEHPGSSVEQFDALVAGRTQQVVPDEEFINRPELITAVLDELMASAGFDDKNLGQIDFNNVGVIGQSFGGYTALAVAGAPLSMPSLNRACPPTFTFNLALLLQCQAVGLPIDPTNTVSFHDPRVRAVVAINPITSAILGPESLAQIEVPVLMMAGSADTIAPMLAEQIRPYTWLQNRDRHLLVLAGGTHFSTIGETGQETFQLPPAVIGPVPDVAQDYTQVMSLAFLSRHLRQDNRYQPVLTSGFTTRYSQPEMPMSLISDLDPELLAERLRLADRLAQMPLAQTPGTLFEQAILQTSAESALTAPLAP